MRSQLLDHTTDNTHADWLLTALTLTKHIASNSVDSISSTHALSVASDFQLHVLVRASLSVTTVSQVIRNSSAKRG